MKNKFLNISIGASLMILSVAFLIRSVNTADATPPSPKEFVTEGTNKIGKYMITISTAASESSIINNAFVWDTETGKSVYYYYITSTDKWVRGNDLPENPMGN